MKKIIGLLLVLITLIACSDDSVDSPSDSTDENDGVVLFPPAKCDDLVEGSSFDFNYNYGIETPDFTNKEFGVIFHVEPAWNSSEQAPIPNKFIIRVKACGIGNMMISERFYDFKPKVGGLFNLTDFDGLDASSVITNRVIHCDCAFITEASYWYNDIYDVYQSWYKCDEEGNYDSDYDYDAINRYGIIVSENPVISGSEYCPYN